MYCSNCGYKNSSNEGFCENCGAALQQPKIVSTKKQSREYSNQDNKQVSYTNHSTVDGNILTLGNYIIMMILSAIPFVGFVLLLIWSFGSDVNINKKNWARATLIFAAVIVVFSFIFYSILYRNIMRSYGF